MKRPPKGWARGSFDCPSVDGSSRRIDCYTHPDAPGLVVNENRGVWVVSHERSGMFINPGFSELAIACHFALAISVQGDFRRTAREILSDEALKGGVVLVRQRPDYASGETFEPNPSPDPTLLDR